MSGDHTAFLSFLRRVLRAASKRIADADPEDLAEMLALQVELDDAITRAVVGLRAAGRSWGEIAAAIGTTRQAAQQRWGVKVTLTLDRSSASAAPTANPEPPASVSRPTARALAG